MPNLTLPTQAEPGWRRAVWSKTPVVLTAAAILAVLLAIDVQAVQWLGTLRLRGIFRQILDALECFGDGVGVALILIAFWTLATERRRILPRLAAASLGAGLSADLVKMLVLRDRPRAFDLAGSSVLDSFHGLLPLLSGGSAGQSFPSAHTATAAGLAVALTWALPQGRRLFFALALGVALQRMTVLAHYPTDVMVGGALGYCWARLCLPGGAIGARFDRLEDRWQKETPQTQPERAAA